MEKLVVRNFGAICDVDIELKPLTIFIGETGTGKSTLAKLISIFRDSRFWFDVFTTTSESDNFFKICLSYYELDNYLDKDTYIHYEVNIDPRTTISFTYSKLVMSTNFKEEASKIVSEILSINEQSDIGKMVGTVASVVKVIFREVIYMPADRGVVSFLAEKFAAIKKEELIGVFPKALIDFTGDFNRISSVLNRHHVDLFDVTYKKSGGKDYIELPNGKVLLLSETASGMQTAIPVVLVLEYFSNIPTMSEDNLNKNIPITTQSKSYTIEEPELNLFPTAQKTLVEFFAEKVLGCGHQLVITTHSPYILTSLNNLLFASRIVEKYPDAQSQLNNTLSMKYFVSESQACVYELLFDNRKVSCTENSISKKTGVIPENILDRSSDCIMGTFNSLMGIYREFRRTTN